MEMKHFLGDAWNQVGTATLEPLRREFTVPTLYYLYYHQNGRAFKFGAMDDSDAQTIAGSLLQQMTTDKGGILYTTQDGRNWTPIRHWDPNGALRVQIGDMVVLAL